MNKLDNNKVSSKVSKLADVMSYLYNGELVYSVTALDNLFDMSPGTLCRRRNRNTDKFKSGVHHYYLDSMEATNMLRSSLSNLTVPLSSTPLVGKIHNTKPKLMTTLLGVVVHCDCIIYSEGRSQNPIRFIERKEQAIAIKLEALSLLVTEYGALSIYR